MVAKLPFEPIGLIQGLSHRNLLGEDFTDCSFIFLYVLCTMSIRQVCGQISFGFHFSPLTRHSNLSIRFQLCLTECSKVFRFFTEQGCLETCQRHFHSPTIGEIKTLFLQSNKLKTTLPEWLLSHESQLKRPFLMNVYLYKRHFHIFIHFNTCQLISLFI